MLPLKILMEGWCNSKIGIGYRGTGPLRSYWWTTETWEPFLMDCLCEIIKGSIFPRHDQDRYPSLRFSQLHPRSKISWYRKAFTNGLVLCRSGLVANGHNSKIERPETCSALDSALAMLFCKSTGVGLMHGGCSQQPVSPLNHSLRGFRVPSISSLSVPSIPTPSRTIPGRDPAWVAECCTVADWFK